MRGTFGTRPYQSIALLAVLAAGCGSDHSASVQGGSTGGVSATAGIGAMSGNAGGGGGGRTGATGAGGRSDTAAGAGGLGGVSASAGRGGDAQGASGSPSGAGGTGAGGRGGGASGVGGTADGGRGAESGGAATGGNGGTSGGGAGKAGSGGRGGQAAAGASGAAGSANNDCTTPPAPSTLVGWATEGTGTTGGGDATPVVVTTAAELTQNLSGNTARVIHVQGSISGSFSIGSNKTIVGICGAQIHGHLGVGGQSNVIVRNLKMVGNNCTDSPDACKEGADAITVGGASHHVWFDHLDVSDGSDGNLDITQGADFVTVSFTKFSYSTKRTDPTTGDTGHRFSNLIGASDTDPADPGHLNITYHHCWWADNVSERMPRSRRGQIHVFNNLFTATGNEYCTNAGQDAKLLVQNNIYSGVSNPLEVSENGSLKSEGNVFTGTSGDATGSGNGFTPPYEFTLDATTDLEATLRASIGPH